MTFTMDGSISSDVANMIMKVGNIVFFIIFIMVVLKVLKVIQAKFKQLQYPYTCEQSQQPSYQKNKSRIKVRYIPNRL